MNISLDSLSALRAIRTLRPLHKLDGPKPRHALEAPWLDEGRRWSARRLAIPWLDGGVPPTEQRPLDVAVPSPKTRIQSKRVCNAVHSGDRPFIDLRDGVSCASPELLFAEMGALMEPAVHLMLGLELCGTFSRSAGDPRDGEVCFGVEPLTTAERIRAYINQPHLKRLPGLEQARELAPLLLDNAWSPREALLAVLLELPVTELGFGIGPIVLNRRVQTGGALLSDTESRVPDILFEGAHVGLNYDGDPHYATAGDTSRDVSVRDKLRDRDLLVAGFRVLPVVHEDLATRGAFDALAYQVMDLLEEETGEKFELQRSKFVREGMAKKRQKLIWSLLPGRRGRRLSQEGIWEQAPVRVIDARITSRGIELLQ